MKLKELLNSDSVYQAMDEAAYEVITAFTHATELTNRKLEPNEGGKISIDPLASLELLFDDYVRIVQGILLLSNQ